MNHLLSALACKLCRLGPNLKVGKKLYLQLIYSSQWSLLHEGASLYVLLTYPWFLLGGGHLHRAITGWHKVRLHDLTSRAHQMVNRLATTGRLKLGSFVGVYPPNLKPEKPRRLWTAQHAKGIFNGFRKSSPLHSKDGPWPKSSKAIPFDPIIGPSKGLHSCFCIWAARVRGISHSPEWKLRRWLKPQWSGISRDRSKMPWQVGHDSSLKLHNSTWNSYIDLTIWAQIGWAGYNSCRFCTSCIYARLPLCICPRPWLHITIKRPPRNIDKVPKYQGPHEEAKSSDDTPHITKFTLQKNIFPTLGKSTFAGLCEKVASG